MFFVSPPPSSPKRRHIFTSLKTRNTDQKPAACIKRAGNLPSSSLPRIPKKNRQLTYLLILRFPSTPSTSKQRLTGAGAAAGTSHRPPIGVPSPSPPGLPAATARSTGSGFGTGRASAQLVRGGDGVGFVGWCRQDLFSDRWVGMG
ncbi:hypothetical protein VC83_02998 [Pseudogymnoascus destructans]|uniref:Uncharacterized protein n=1 Tax=Pseudogymnoascus destructans TaxID=655981 RepID=A0A177AFY0_9PEZI|nr:uncharacterized protein VC83_02998 [Pseudogymnoascus destructans]OAF60064.1 hypothetical protein VC83_02998 [Pseudogymnoascus destructans]